MSLFLIIKLSLQPAKFVSSQLSILNVLKWLLIILSKAQAEKGCMNNRTTLTVIAYVDTDVEDAYVA